MKELKNPLTVVNTSSRQRSRTESSHTPANNSGGRSRLSSGSGMGTNKVLEIVSPIIAENYADGISLLKTESYLFNPAFANDAEGWIIPIPTGGEEVKAYVKVSDYKNRLIIKGGGEIFQQNELIRKPDTHFEYIFTPDEEGKEENEEDSAAKEEEGNGETEEQPFIPESFVQELPEWEIVPFPPIAEGKELKRDKLYISISYICNANGILTIGFPITETQEEGRLGVQWVSMEKSDKIQTYQWSGTWDGTGDFVLAMTGGEIEVVDLTFTDTPLEQYRAQTDTALIQIQENISYIYQFLYSELQRLKEIQDKITQLYFNDKTIKGWIENINTTIQQHTEILVEYGNKFNQHETIFQNIQTEIQNIKETDQNQSASIQDILDRITSLGSSISGINTELSKLDKRISILESDSDNGEEQ